MTKRIIQRKISVLITLLCVISTTGFAQLQSYKKGLASFDKGYYDLAVNDLLKVKEIDPSQETKLNYTIAEAYRLSNRWIEAIPFYEKALETGSEDKDAVFHLAYALKAGGQYDEALENYKKYVNLATDNKTYNEWANREINTLQIIPILKQKEAPYQFRNLKEINSEGAEFSPIVYKNKLVFSASRKDKTYSNGLPFLGIYSSTITDDLGTIGDVERFSDAIFDDERNEGTPTFSPDGKIVIFARGNSGKRKDLSPDVDLYISRNVPNSGWTEPKLVSASDSASWDGSPSFSGDGKTIYFASNRPGGSGGMDLYRVNMDASGRFGNPSNMGKAINTPGNEMFPFVSADGELFFASDGHPGIGKLDLFVAVRKKGKISIENLGIPFNSSMDDFGYSKDDYGNIFFSSNRLGGQGDDDIYFYQAPPKDEIAKNVDPLDPKQGGIEVEEPEPEMKVVNYFLAGKITDKTNEEPVPDAKLKVYKLDAGIEELFAEVNASEKGLYGPLKLEEDTDYLLIVEKEGFLKGRQSFTMYGRSIPQILLRQAFTDTTFISNLVMDKAFVGKTFKLENILYDFNKFDIRTDAALELDKLVQILLDNPTIKIELGSHTDSRGTAVYNQRLSQQRAESAVNYIVSRGISRSRITAQGYGEEELIEEAARTEEEHQINRRTEFKITGFDAEKVETEQ
ncbi:Tetratricopeptide repeat-containing protein [Spirosomataceae bacterium TFI 002]|nr:Tetratricopeptide repeat-containing protein [Spirosomataceae bacterium TFI 002]